MFGRHQLISRVAIQPSIFLPSDEGPVFRCDLLRQDRLPRPVPDLLPRPRRRRVRPGLSSHEERRDGRARLQRVRLRRGPVPPRIPGAKLVGAEQV